MYLKALEIHGFKSFPDKTRLNFTGGLTAVVGPNGSGKSNISDALRWVLGEQSTKTLRGAKMEDVIFGGTQLRKAMGFAQVTLYIDNLARSIQIDTDEVAITRKLYRSGDSEYKINDQNVRLKDIVELFMDTGLGRDGYSMIGQGKIAEIVGAKSGNRREIFEEAAGISKFRYRKTEAERKLLAAGENLLRLKDIMAELESRVEPLRVQAEKASQFVKHAEHKKLLELSIWSAQLQKTKEQLRAEEDKVAVSQGAHAEVEDELSAVEKTADEVFAQLSKCTVDIDDLRAGIKIHEESAAEAQSQIAVCENNIFHNNSSIERIKNEITEQNQTELQTAQQLTEKEAELVLLQQEADDAKAELQKISEEYAELAITEQQGVTALADARQALSALALLLSEAKVAQVTAQAAFNEAQNRTLLLKQSQDEKADKLKAFTAELNDCTELCESIDENLQGLKNSVGGIQLKLKSRLQKQQEFTAELRSIEQRAGEKQQKARLLESLEQSMEGFAGSVKYILNRQKHGEIKGVHSAVSKLIEVKPEYSVAIETALGGALQNIVVDDDSVAKRAIAMLKESRSGRATFLPVSTIRGNKLNESGLSQKNGFVALASDLVECKPEYRAIVESMLGRVVVAQNLDDAVAIAKAFGNRFRIVTLDGQLVNVGGSMTGGFTAKSAGLLSRQSEIERLKAEADLILAGAEGINAKLKTSAEEISALNAQILAVESEMKTAGEDKIRYESEKKRILLALDDINKNSTDAVAQLKRLEESMAGFNTNISAAYDKVNALTQEQEQTEALIAKSSTQHEATRAMREGILTKRSEAELLVLAKSKDIEGTRQAIDDINSRKAGQSQRAQIYEQQINGLKLQNDTITNQIEKLKAENKNVANETQKAQAAINELQQKRQQCEQRSTEIRLQEKDIMARKEQLARELARVEEKKFSLQAEYDAVIAKMWDEYELTRTEAEALAQPVEDMQRSLRTLSEVKAKIRALGTVNLEAIDEYEQVSQRYMFLKTQIDDVEKSRNQLNKIIYDLTSQMREMFTESFAKINENFGRVFVELFGGGKASLELTDDTDVLESGIEINVQPPGKLIKNLASLSGGEQAFVAIAIYFAILKVRPAPFCLLDEIEAALDDVNVTKYAQYLKRLGEKTQFVAITHRRGTMEEADVLYGVTMQEEGVSKVLELAVSELESKLGMKA
ncbi:MAG: chromosome segregation protein SMC [Hydrogenoanaerobacterium sp.]